MEGPALTRDQLIGQIRFGISNLTARSGHHEFEEGCRHLARARIATNVLPATGPVSAGGDQGKDFETFHSYLRDELGGHGWFVGHVATGPVVFLCTLQRGSVAGKVGNDVAKICGGAVKPDRIYAFLGADLPVAERHRIIDRALAKHSVTVEVLDGPAIAEQLADHDTFWIAVRYLSLPAHFTPPRPENPAPDGRPEWYVDCLTRWRADPAPRPLLSDLLDLRDGLRRATFDPQTREDLPFWLGLARQLTSDDIEPDVRLRAHYEVAVATIRGLGDLRPADAHVEAFLAEAAQTDDPARLEDASVLLSYATVAASLGHSNLDLERLAAHRDQARGRATELLDRPEPPGRRARLLQVTGHLALTPDPQMLEVRTDSAPPPAAAVAELDRPAEVVAPDAAAAMAEVVDLEGALAAWTELVRVMPDTPLFPVEDFADIVQALVPLLVDAPGWPELADALDAALARTAGGGRAGEACRDRSLALRDAGRLLAALHEMHRAKLEWWTGDTLRGSALAMATIADLYMSLGLPLAAKQYALAAAGTAHSSGQDDLRDLVAAGMLQASHISHGAGDWMAGLEELEAGLLALHHLGSRDAESGEHLLSRATFVGAVCLRLAREIEPALIEQIEGILERVGILDVCNEALKDVPPLTAEEWSARADEDLHERPFSDLGARYVVRFSALGTVWSLSCDNTYADVRATQRLAAALQITLVELASEDLCLLPTAIDLDVVASTRRRAPEEHRVRWQPSNDGRQGDVELSASAPGTPMDPEDNFKELLSTITELLMDVSLLPTRDYLDALHRAFERGLWHKVTIGRPYDDLAEIVPAQRFQASKRIGHEPPLGRRTDPPSAHADLVWQDGPGPTFSQEEAAEMAGNRYDKITSVLPTTLAQLAADEDFQQTVARLRAEGWLDWHVLVGVYNIAVNHRMDEAGLNTRAALSRPESEQAVRALAETPRLDQGDPIPLDEFSEDALRFGRLMGIAPLLAHWHLESRQRTPDYPAVERVLATRYAYWTIDAPHEDPFPPRP